MSITITCYEPLIGSPAEALWREGEASYVEAGFGRHGEVTAPPADLIGWCVLVEGEPAALQVRRLLPDLAEAQSLLTWVRPVSRRRGIDALLRQHVDADLLARGFSQVRSWLVAADRPGRFSYSETDARRRGAKVGEQVLHLVGRPVRYDEYLRSLSAGPATP
jgi:GNAT superfamily N-acetyltransferase